MRIRQVEITNFRGIKKMCWSIPKDRKLICLIGPGDSGKSSILDAIYLTLGDRWNPSISDTDFYETDVTLPIIIRCVVSDLPMNLIKDSAFGLNLSGIDDSGTLHQDPIDGTEPALIVQLRIDETLEPAWSIERLNRNHSINIGSKLRREFATFKVDDRTDVHLRWTRTSALGRISASSGSAGNAMAVASRAAREAIAQNNDENLNKLTAQVQDKLNEVGSGSFCSIQAGLDTSLSSTGGNLALYESKVPLTNYGLGSKRLAGLGVQQLAASGKSILLLDEIEHGLEPHRLVRLIQYVQTDPTYSQVFVTTHSPVAVEQSSTDNLTVVQNNAGAVTVKFLPEDSKTLRLRRSRPSSFLGRRVVVVEGKTEEGFVLELIHMEDEQRMIKGQAVAAGIGSVVQDGQGGSEVPLRAVALLELGYRVAMFLDNDDSRIDKHVSKAAELGAKVVRWSNGNNTEQQITTSLNISGLSSLLELGVEVRSTQQTVLNDLKAAGLPNEVASLDVSKWVEDGHVSIEKAKQIIAQAMIDTQWFKLVDSGKLLGAWVLEHRGDFNDAIVGNVIDSLKTFVYEETNEPLTSEGDADVG